MSQDTASFISVLEIAKDALHQKVALGKHAAKICSSTEWEVIFNKGYFTAELTSLTQQLSLATGEEKESLVARIAAIGSLQNYMEDLVNQTKQAQADLDSIELELNHQRGLL